MRIVRCLVGGWLCIYGVVGWVSVVHGATDLTPWGEMSYLPALGWDGVLGGRWTSVAYALDPLAVPANPATMLSRPGPRLGVRYQQWFAMQQYNEVWLQDSFGGLAEWAVQLNGTGFGISVFRHRPFWQRAEWTRTSFSLPGGGSLWEENIQWTGTWSRTGVAMAMRLQEDFVVGGQILRDQWTTDGSLQTRTTVNGERWTFQYRADARDWSGSVGVQWWLSPQVVFGLAYHWMPVFTVEVQGRSLDDPEGSGVTIPLRVAFPNALAIGLHVADRQWVIAIDGWRWKTGRMNTDPQLYLHLGEDERLEFRPIWGWRISAGAHLNVRPIRMFVQGGVWYRPGIRPVWIGPEGQSPEPVVRTLWPNDTRHLHWMFGVSIQFHTRLTMGGGLTLGKWMRMVQVLIQAQL